MSSASSCSGSANPITDNDRPALRLPWAIDPNEGVQDQIDALRKRIEELERRYPFYPLIPLPPSPTQPPPTPWVPAPYWPTVTWTISTNNSTL